MSASGGKAALVLSAERCALATLTLLAALPTPVLAQTVAPERIDPRHVLMIGVVVGVIAFACVAALYAQHTARKATVSSNEAGQDAERLKRDLDRLHLVLAGEPQALIAWTADGGPELLASTLPRLLELPRDAPALLRFDAWLAPERARPLAAALADLKADGTPFDLLVYTPRRDGLLAEGRITGDMRLLRLRPASSEYLRLVRDSKEKRSLSLRVDALSSLLGAVPLPAWRRDEFGGIAWVNAAYARAVGLSSPEAVVTKQLELVAEERRPKPAGRPEAHQSRLPTAPNASAGGAYDVVSVSAIDGNLALAIPAGIQTAAHATEGDIATRLAILDRIGTGVSLFNAEQRLTYFNPAFSNMLRLDHAWLASRPHNGELLDRLRQSRGLPEQADYRAWRQRQLEIFEHGGSREESWHIPDGRTINSHADRGADGSVSCLYDDVTDRLALESRLNALVRVQGETLDRLSEGIAVFGMDGRLTLFNPAFATIWRLNVRALEERPHVEEIIRSCRVLHDDHEEWDRVRLAATAIDLERRGSESQLDRGDGSVIAAACLPLPDGGTLLTYLDVTDSKHVERALIDRNEALVAADRMKTHFISHISYELRTPLTTINGYGEMLATGHAGPLNDRQREYLAAIQSSGGTLLAIINDILDLTTIDAGALELKLAPIRPDEVIGAATANVREKSLTARVAIDIRIDPMLGSIIADSRRVAQILENLLANAIGFSEPGGTVTLSARREGEMAAFTVEDRGSGIPDNFLGLAFGRFESRSQGSRHRGVGLGLAIVKSLVGLHGGDVSLDSTPGKGTRVHVRLPIAGIRAPAKAG